MAKKNRGNTLQASATTTSASSTAKPSSSSNSPSSRQVAPPSPSSAIVTKPSSEESTPSLLYLIFSYMNFSIVVSSFLYSSLFFALVWLAEFGLTQLVLHIFHLQLGIKPSVAPVSTSTSIPHLAHIFSSGQFLHDAAKELENPELLCIPILICQLCVALLLAWLSGTLASGQLLAPRALKVQLLATQLFKPALIVFMSTMFTLRAILANIGFHPSKPDLWPFPQGFVLSPLHFSIVWWVFVLFGFAFAFHSAAQELAIELLERQRELYLRAWQWQQQMLAQQQQQQQQQQQTHKSSNKSAGQSDDEPIDDDVAHGSKLVQAE